MDIAETTRLSSSNRRREECKRQYQFYHRKFPSIPTMTSEELMERQKRQYQKQQQQQQNEKNGESNPNEEDVDDETLLLIDVRTKPEQEISMIPGAITYDDVINQEKLPPACPEKTTIVTYCTIGYRSGLEAQRLLDKYPELEGRIYSLDGILMYSHVAPTLAPGINNKSSNTIQQQQQEQQKVVTRVHTFAKTWEPCANDEQYEPIFFGFPSLLCRLLQVGILVVVRGFQHFGHWITNALKCMFCVQRPQQQQENNNNEGIMMKHH